MPAEAGFARPNLASRAKCLQENRLADFFLFDQSERGADVQPQVTGEKSSHSLDIERAVGKVRAGVRSALHDPDLARPAVGVIQPAAVIDGREQVGAAVDEKQRTRLQ